MKNYCFHSIDCTANSGGIGIYLHNSLNYKIRPDLRLNENLAEDIWVEIKSDNDNKSYIVGEMYFHPHSSITTFQLKLEQTIEKINSKKLKHFIMGDFNINLLSDNSKIFKYKEFLESFGAISLINCPTRFMNKQTPSLLDHIYCNDNASNIISGSVFFDISDHNPTFVSAPKNKLSHYQEN